MSTISGYTFGTTATRSPLTVADLDNLKTTVLFDEEDEKYLRLAGDVLADQIDDVLDVWYGFVGANPHLVYYFGDVAGNPDSDYLAAVRARFGQWIKDTCQKPYDQTWLDYQQEIGLRHHRQKKNQVDNANAVDHIGMRYLIAFIYPITATMRPFLEKGNHDPEIVEKMQQAWFKAVVLTVVLWSAPYTPQEDF